MKNHLPLFLSLFLALYPLGAVFSQPSEEIRQRVEWIERYNDLNIEGLPVTAKKGVREFLSCQDV